MPERPDAAGAPLLAILAAAAARPALNRLAHWNLHHREWVRLAPGGGMVVMWRVILATVWPDGRGRIRLRSVRRLGAGETGARSIDFDRKVEP